MQIAGAKPELRQRVKCEAGEGVLTKAGFMEGPVSSAPVVTNATVATNGLQYAKYLFSAPKQSGKYGSCKYIVVMYIHVMIVMGIIVVYDCIVLYSHTSMADCIISQYVSQSCCCQL